MGKYRKAFRCAVAAVGCFLFVTGCSTMATIYKKDGSIVEERIRASDSSSIHLSDGSTVTRADIRDIDHPGNVVVAVSSFPAVLGLVLTVGATQGDASGVFVFLIGLCIAIPSTAANIWGWYTFGRSRSAAKPSRPPAGPKIVPVALTDGERTYLGLGMSWGW